MGRFAPPSNTSETASCAGAHSLKRTCPSDMRLGPNTGLDTAALPNIMTRHPPVPAPARRHGRRRSMHCPPAADPRAQALWYRAQRSRQAWRRQAEPSGLRRRIHQQRENRHPSVSILCAARRSINVRCCGSFHAAGEISSPCSSNQAISVTPGQVRRRRAETSASAMPRVPAARRSAARRTRRVPHCRAASPPASPATTIRCPGNRRCCCRAACGRIRRPPTASACRPRKTRSRARRGGRARGLRVIAGSSVWSFHAPVGGVIFRRTVTVVFAVRVIVFASRSSQDRQG